MGGRGTRRGAAHLDGWLVGAGFWVFWVFLLKLGKVENVVILRNGVEKRDGYGMLPDWIWHS